MIESSHDALVRLRHIFAIMSGATPASGNEEYWDGDILWITPEDLSGKDSYWLADTHRKITRSGYDSSGTTLAPPHSIALSKRAPIGHLALLQKPACSNQGCFLLVPISNVETRFYYYHLSSRIEWLQALGSGSTFMELGIDALRSLRVPLPPFPRQRAIADYLDRETGRLDALVAAKRRLLELLAEKRRALIAHAVTRGLEPEARDSGGFAVEENGATAAGDGGVKNVFGHTWPTKRLRFLTRRDLSIDQKKALAKATQVTFLPMENIGEKGELDCSLTRDIKDVQEGYTQFFDGDVLIAKITPCFENGKGAIVRGTLSGVGFGTTELHVLAPNDEIDARFLYYITTGDHFRKLGEAAMFGAAGQKRVPEDFVRDYRVPLPPLSQQRAIADYLDRETARLDALAGRTRESVALLRERRAALISAAVGGRWPVAGGQ